MQIINSIKNNYILRLIYCLGGLTFTYKLIRKQIKNIQQLLSNKKVCSQTTTFDTIIQNISVEQNSLAFLNQQVIYGKTMQIHSQQLPQFNLTQDKFLSVKNKSGIQNDSCFLLVDSLNKSLEVNVHENIPFSDQLYQQVKLSDSKTKKKLKILGYNKLFVANLIEHKLEFGTPIFIIGDLIYNKNTQSIRCFRQYFMGDLKTMKSFLQSSIKKQSFLLIINLLFFSFFCYEFYTIHKKKTKQQTRLQKIIISKGNDSLKCQECKKQLIDTFFSPCGHFNLCFDCAKPFQNCPNCNEYIEETIKTFKN